MIPSTTAVGVQVCTPITIIGDDIIEPDEFFQVAFSVVDSDDTAQSSVFRITIADDGDGKKILVFT